MHDSYSWHAKSTTFSGGGIGGFTLASVLARHAHPDSPIEVHVYEAAQKISTIGAGLLIWPRTWHLIDLLGLEVETARISTEPPSEVPKPGFLYRLSDRQREPYTFYELMLPRATTLHRADLLDVLRYSLPTSYTIHTAKRLVCYAETQDSTGKPILTLYFTDGTTAETDVLVGADGLKSATRGCMYTLAHERDCTPCTDVLTCPRCAVVTPQWSGMIIWRCLIPEERLRSVNPAHRALKFTLSHVVAYPISNGRIVNFIAFYTQPELEGTPYPDKSGEPAAKEEVLAHFVGWEREVLELLECTENLTKWAINCMGALPFSVSRRVALMGDAAHAKQTHQGAGAGQAMEDGYVLGRLLTHPSTTLARVPAVFQLFQKTRLHFTQDAAQVSRLTGRMVEFNAEGFYDGSDVPDEKAQLAALGRGIRELWNWQVDGNVDTLWERAEAGLAHLAGDENGFH
ncbi:hypothetical protein BKA93DRAFT_725368 [Sparassis latifolia]